MGFVLRVKGRSLGIKSVHTVNVDTLFNFHIHTHSWCSGYGHFWGDIDTSNSDV